eukprot:Nk52_evm10s304 gene=Nk52_evmTU10s304
MQGPSKVLDATFQLLLQTIELASGEEQRHDTSDADLQQVLERNCDNLGKGLELFGVPNAESLKKVTSRSTSGKGAGGGEGGGGSSLLGSTGKGGKQEMPEIGIDAKLLEFLKRFSKRVELDEWQCYEIVVKYFKFGAQIGRALSRVTYDDQLLEHLVFFYYEERLCLLRCIGALFRSAGDTCGASSMAESENGTMQRKIGAFLKKLIDGGLVERIIEQYTKVSGVKVPAYEGKDVLLTRHQASQWLIQNYKEQCELLECLFLAFYEAVPCQPDMLLQLCETFRSNDFSKQKVDEGLSSMNLRRAVERASSIQILLVIECFRLEEMECASQDELENANHLMIRSNAKIMEKLDAYFCTLGGARCHGPLVFLWFTLRSKAKQAKMFPFMENGQHEHEVENKLRLIVVHLQPIEYMLSMLKGGVIDNSLSDNITAYKSVSKGFLSLILSFWNISSLEDLDPQKIVKLACVIHERQPDLCRQFWQSEFQVENLNVLLTMSRINFPLNFTSFTELITALSSSKECLSEIFEYLNHLPTFTGLLPEEATTFRGCSRVGFNNSVMWNTNCIECVKDTEELVLWNVCREYCIVPSLKFNKDVMTTQQLVHQQESLKPIDLPVGTLGKATGKTLYPERSFPMRVQWKFDYSFWHLAFLITDFFIEGQGPQDPQLLNCYARTFGLNEASNFVVDALEAILKLVYELLKSDISLTEVIESYLTHYSFKTVQGEEAELSFANSADLPKSDMFLDKLFRILERCSTGTGVASKITTVCLQCINGFAFTYPRETWTLLQQSSVMPHMSATLGRCLGFNSRNASVNGNIRNLLYDVECPNGEYPVTLAILDLLNTLLKQSQADIGSYSQSSTWRQIQTCELLDLISYVQSDIFANYSGWRYKHLLEKFSIGLRALNIFLDIVNDVPYSLVNGGDGVSLKGEVIESFLRDTSLQNSLINIIAMGSEAVRDQYAAQNFEEGNVLDSLIAAAFTFLNVLLDNRTSTLTYCSTTGKKYEMSSLETGLLSRTVDRDHSKHLVGVIASYVSHPYHSDTPALSVRTLRYIALISSYVEGRPPSLLGYFGSYAEGLRNAFVSKLCFSDSGVELQIEILKFVTSIIESQSGLIALFLDLSSSLGGKKQTSLGGVKESGGNSNSVGEDSILHFVLKVVGNAEANFKAKPRLLAHVLTFLLTLWEGASEHHGVLHFLRSEKDFWSNLMKPVFLCELISFEPNFAKNKGKELLQYNHRVMCVSSILRIVSLEIFFVPVQDPRIKEPTNTSVCLDEPLVKAIEAIFDKSVFFEWLKTKHSSNTWARNSALLNHTLEKNAAKFKNLKLEDFRHAYSDLEYGRNYIYDSSLLLKKMKLETLEEKSDLNFSDFDFENIFWESQRNAKEEKELNSFVSLVEYANNLWSYADGYLVLLRSWKMFMEVGCIRQQNIFRSIFANESDKRCSLKKVLEIADWIAEFASMVPGTSSEDNTVGSDINLEDYASVGANGYIVSLVCKELSEMFLSLMQRSLGILSNGDCDFPTKDCVSLLQASLRIYSAVEGNNAVSEPLKLSLLSAVCIILEHVERYGDFEHDVELLREIDGCANILMPALASLLFSSLTLNTPLQDNVNIESNRMCIMCLTIFGELLKFGPGPSVWLLTLFQQKSLFSLLFDHLSALVVSLRNPELCESILLLLLSLSQIPQAAEVMARNGLLHHLSQACSSTNCGKLFQEYNDLGERNIWHNCWCLIISVFSFSLRSLRSQDYFVEQCIDFVSVHKDKLFRQIFAIVQRCEFKLSIATVYEIEKVTSLAYELGHVYRRFKFKFPNVTREVQQMICILCHKFAYVLNRPSQMERVLVVMSRREKEWIAGGVKGSQLAQHVELRMHGVMRNCVGNFRLVTPNVIQMSLSSAAIDVEGVDILFMPHLHLNASTDPPSLGTLVNILNFYSGFLKTKSSITSKEKSSILLIIESTLAVVLSYYGIFASTHTPDDRNWKDELFSDLGRELVSFLDEMHKTFNRSSSSTASLLNPPASSSPSKRLSHAHVDSGSPSSALSFASDRGISLGKLFKANVKDEEFFRIAELFIKNTFQ